MTEVVDERLLVLTRRLGELALGSADVDATTAAVEGLLLPALDLAIHQSDAPDLTEAAFATRTTARTYLATVADAGSRATTCVHLYRRLLAQADALAASCVALEDLVRSTVGDDVGDRGPDPAHR